MSHRCLSLLGKADETWNWPFNQYRGAGSPASTGPHVMLHHNHYSTLIFTLCPETNALTESIGWSGQCGYIPHLLWKPNVRYLNVLQHPFIYQIQNIYTTKKCIAIFMMGYIFIAIFSPTSSLGKTIFYSTRGWPYTEGIWLYFDYFIWCVFFNVVVSKVFVMCRYVYEWVL